MDTRLSVSATAPALYRAMIATTTAVRAAGLPPRLIHLVDLRVSQINGCAFCIDMHGKEARHAGETEERLDALAGWAASDRFEADERAAFAWAEALTRNRHDEIDGAHRALQRHFDDGQIGVLTVAVAQINAWNRLGIAQYREAVSPAAA
ncbi:AhpD family alkylhydroperoxidase [Azospirillum agricola]|uniref:carboxymuconolactone decarboxylase family protein n=1 Tax=Azospirillum agricola TaxID=1720247 RepID=UPI001AE49C5A|nr:carboxymuconolactone decarboxylase family protein [Azospirillum agricola]MBP2228357.1 AhpD family alkylhydroperoxidase [Azospirillum agricola]